MEYVSSGVKGTKRSGNVVLPSLSRPQRWTPGSQEEA